VEGCGFNSRRSLIPKKMEHEKKLSWFKAMRSPEAVELIKLNPNAFVLAFIIAYRARWDNAFNCHNLKAGEAFIGDYKNMGLTRGQYRIALDQLTKFNFAATHPTNKGTIARLLDARLFDVEKSLYNQQNSHQATNKQPTSNQQTATNYNYRSNRSNRSKLEGEQADAGVDSCAIGANTVETPSAFLSAKKSANDIGNEKEITRINDELKNLGRATDYAKGSEERNRIIQLRDRKKVLLKLLGRVA
jgi:hypothetical protein